MVPQINSVPTDSGASSTSKPAAAVAAVLGMRCRLVQEEWTRWEDPVCDKVGNILLSRLMEPRMENWTSSLTKIPASWEFAGNFGLIGPRASKGHA